MKDLLRFERGLEREELRLQAIHPLHAFARNLALAAAATQREWRAWFFLRS